MARIRPRRETLQLRRRAGLAAFALALLLGCAREAAPPTAGPPSAVLIIVDTLRADRIGAYGYERPTTPNLDRLEGAPWIRFDNALAHSPWTLPSFATILTSLAPPVHRAGERVTLAGGTQQTFLRLRKAIRTAPEILAEEHGFRTGAFVNNPYLDPRFGLDAGFEVYDHDRGGNLESRDAEEMVDRAIRWLDGLDPEERYFLLLHLFDPHVTYDPPPRYAERFAGRERAAERPDHKMYRRIKLEGFEPSADEKSLIADLYDGEIAHVDAQIARLLDALAERQRLDSTAVIITADHGEEFWDHGGFEHGHALYQELVRVPLWLKLPAGSVHASGLPPDGSTDRLVCHADLLPTLLDVLELTTETPLMGQSLLREPGPAASSGCYLGSMLYGIDSRGIVREHLKLIESPSTGTVELYDLAADPDERRDLSSLRPDDVARLRAELERLDAELSRLGEALGAVRPDPLAPELIERLRSLGYVR
jgi:arylsulfatase A-like enzyme